MAGSATYCRASESRASVIAARGGYIGRADRGHSRVSTGCALLAGNALSADKMTGHRNKELNVERAFAIQKMFKIAL